MNAQTPIETRLEAFRERWSGKVGKMLIGGEWREAESGETFSTEDPATGEKLADVASAGQADVDAAVAAARTTFEGPWSKVKPDERARLINKLADLIEAHGDELALTETLDVGRPIQFSRMADVGGAIGQLRYQAGWATKIQGETNEISAPGEWLSYVLMIAGWFILIRAVSDYLRARRTEQVVLASPDRGLGVAVVGEGEDSARAV